MTHVDVVTERLRLMDVEKKEEERQKTTTNSSLSLSSSQLQSTDPLVLASESTATTVNGNNISTLGQHGNRRVTQFAREYAGRPRILFAATFIWLTMTGGRFLAPFLEHTCQLNGQQIGQVLSGQQLVLTVASAAAGRAADRLEAQGFPGTGRLLVIMAGVSLGSLAMSLHSVAQFLPRVPWFRSVTWHTLVQCLQGLGVSMVFPVLDGLTVEFLEHQQQEPQNYSDNTMGSSNGNNNSRLAYGRERLHGPFWWALANLALSPLLDIFGFQVCYPLSWIGVGVVALSVYLYCSSVSSSSRQQEYLPTMQAGLEQTFVTNEDERNESEARENSTIPVTIEENDNVVTMYSDPLGQTSQDDLSLWQLLRLLLASATGIGFLVCIFCISSGQAVVDNLIFLYFEALGSQWFIMGVTVVVKIAAEVPVFFYGPQLLQTLGAARVLLLACLCYWIRVLLYPFLPHGNVWYVLALEPLHGVTYGAAQLSMVEFVASHMPVGYEASGQGLVYLFKECGSVLGVWVGGWAQDRMGPAFMFYISASFVAAGAITLTVTTSGLRLLSKAARVFGLGHHVESYQQDNDEAVVPCEGSVSLPDRNNRLSDETPME